jgi:hypothetical protein
MNPLAVALLTASYPVVSLPYLIETLYYYPNSNMRI